MTAPGDALTSSTHNFLLGKSGFDLSSCNPLIQHPALPGLFVCLRRGLTVQPRLASNSPSSCCSLLSAGITCMKYHTQLQFFCTFHIYELRLVSFWLCDFIGTKGSFFTSISLQLTTVLQWLISNKLSHPLLCMSSRLKSSESVAWEIVFQVHVVITLDVLSKPVHYFVFCQCSKNKCIQIFP
jgi:hypothetical protein